MIDAFPHSIDTHSIDTHSIDMHSTTSSRAPAHSPACAQAQSCASAREHASARLRQPARAWARLWRVFASALFAALFTAVCAAPLAAQTVTDPAPLRFENAVEEKRFHMLVAELRCVMCQNQSLSDSNAQIAVDLRREVLALMRDGRSDSEIRDHLVARYGEFVLYRPRLHGATWLLWFGPLLFVLGGVVALVAVLRRSRPRAAAVPPPDDTEQEW